MLWLYQTSKGTLFVPLTKELVKLYSTVLPMP